MAGTLRPYPPHPSSLMAVEILEYWNKNVKQKYFFLNGPALYPPPPLNSPAIKRRTFFAASLKISLYRKQIFFTHSLK
jgi:hypothetical protein